jgi:hypothetical protein
MRDDFPKHQGLNCNEEKENYFINPQFDWFDQYFQDQHADYI